MKKKNLILMMVFVFTAGVLLTGCTGDGSSEVSAENNVDENSSNIEDSNNNNNNVDDGIRGNGDEDEDDTNDDKTAVEDDVGTDEILEILSESFEDFDVRYEEEDNAFIFDPTNPEYVNLVAGKIDGGYDKDVWEKFPETLLKKSEDFYKKTGRDYAFALSNPADKSTLLHIAISDEIVYDFADDI